jgi:hypothetical protein
LDDCPASAASVLILRSGLVAVSCSHCKQLNPVI